SRYLAVSKLLGPVDLTIGVGQGILAGESTAGGGSVGDASVDAGFDFLTSGLTENDTKVFGGAELRVTENLSLLAEYSSIDYEILQGAEQTEPPESPYNFAVKYRLAKNSLLSASYLRGNVFGFSLAADFPLKPEGILPWKVQPFWVPSEELKKKASEASNEELAFILRHEVAAEKFSNVRTSVGDAAVWVEIENPTYLSNTKAIGRALRAVCALVPPRIHWIYISLKAKDIILLTIKIGREDFEAYVDDRMEAIGLLEFVEFNNEGNEQRDVFLLEEEGASALTAAYGSKKLKFGVKPSWKTYFNDPSGFLKHRFSLSWNVGYYPWAGGFFKAGIRTPLYNGITGISRTTETNPVRTDTAEYLGEEDIRLEQLAFGQIFNLPYDLLARAEIGLFESAYGGVGGEVFSFFQNGRFGVGLEGECVWKREPDHDLKFKDSARYKTAFLNLYYNLAPELGIDLGLKLGRFLGGDKGGRLDMSRTFRHFTMGAWYTITDTDVFTASYNKDYHDKGIYLRIPFSLFTDSDDSKKLNYSFRPWGRDTGQTVSQINSLYPMAARGSINDFKQTIEELKD
ncbi:MAG: YjbH domain-containing protein, partial [Desulfobulbaceae bacterium]|nr:YjbH domain-containing protein [Desulfobulbaceae bacterium]